MIKIKLTFHLMKKNLVNITRKLIVKANCFEFSSLKYFSSSSPSKMTDIDFVTLFDRAKRIVPDLSDIKYKGKDGRIGVVGGSIEYTGAPYFSAISALRTGADLVHVYTTTSAAPTIKSYSPDLIVHPMLFQLNGTSLQHLHVMVIGPGLGRNVYVPDIKDIIKVCNTMRMPLIFDADGLHMLMTEKKLLKGYTGSIILTPNQNEFNRMFGTARHNYSALFSQFGEDIKMTVLAKGFNDLIYFDIEPQHFEEFRCPPGGSGRRCGGQGDLLAGSIAAFLHWAIEAKDPNPELVACFAASLLIKNTNRLCFQDKGRGMVCNDMIDYIHKSFKELFERVSQ